VNAPSVLLVSTPAGPTHITAPAPREAWWSLADQDAGTYVTQTPAWLDCICATGPYQDASRLYEFQDGTRLLLPLVRRKQRPGWLDTEESWPADWGVGGPVSQGDVSLAKARAVFDDLARRPVLQVGVRFRPKDADIWASAAPPGFQREPHMTQVLDLDGGFGTLWERRFHTRVRRDIRRAERSQVEVEADRTGRLVPLFGRLYEQSIVRWAGQQHEPLALARWRRRRAFPLRRLEAVATRLGASCTIWTAWCAGEPAAAIVVLRHGHYAKLWRGAMNRELAHPVRAVPLLYKHAIDDACATGCRWFDMGESAPGSSLAHFKGGFGSASCTSPRYFRERLPVSVADRWLRTAVKRVIRFQDV
jgi:hypothetical protein